MAAGVTDHVGSLEEIAELAKPVALAKRGPFMKSEAA
jgi:hypothetical protein